MKNACDIKGLASFYVAAFALFLPAALLFVLDAVGCPEQVLAFLFGALAVYYLSFAVFTKPMLFYSPEQLTTGVKRLLAAAWGVLWLFVPVDTLMDDPTTILVFLAALWLFFISLALLAVAFESGS